MYIKANHRVFKGAPQPTRATTKLSSCAWFHVRDETTELSLNAQVCTKQYPSVLINVMLARALKKSIRALSYDSLIENVDSFAKLLLSHFLRHDFFSRSLTLGSTCTTTVHKHFTGYLSSLFGTSTPAVTRANCIKNLNDFVNSCSCVGWCKHRHLRVFIGAKGSFRCKRYG